MVDGIFAGYIRLFCFFFLLVPALDCHEAVAQNVLRNSNKVAPFNAIEFRNEKMMVRCNKEWFELLSVNGVKTEILISKCVENSWKPAQRIGEDLVPLMALLGHEMKRTASLVLIDKNGVEVTRPEILMTAANRKAIWNEYSGKQIDVALRSNPFATRLKKSRSPFSNLRWDDQTPWVKIDDVWFEIEEVQGVPLDKIRTFCREGKFEFPLRFSEDTALLMELVGVRLGRKAQISLRNLSGVRSQVEMTVSNENREKYKATGPLLWKQDIEKDLLFFEKHLKASFAYREFGNSTWLEMLEDVRSRIPNEVYEPWIVDELTKIMSSFIDGHARVQGSIGRQRGYLPFLMNPVGNRIAVCLSEREGPLCDGFPFIRAIDGVEIEKWLSVSRKYVARGSAQLVARRSIGQLRWLNHFRKELGLPLLKTVNVELFNENGDSKMMELDVAMSRPSYGTWPGNELPKIMEDVNVGYLPLLEMNDDATELINEWMPRFKKTSGLIIDVRGNGGGIRRPLLEMAGFLMKADEEPKVVNACAYILADGFRKDHLSRRRHVYRENSSKFGDLERAAIAKFKSSFQPETKLPKGFSDWHYLVLSKSIDDTRYYYDKPVVVLMDEGCFSATDIFLSAIKHFSNVTLVGAPSSGGSARSHGSVLPMSKVSVVCASMASYQADGRLFDTHGITPHVLVQRPADYYYNGGTDVVLQKAIDLLKNKK